MQYTIINNKNSDYHILKFKKLTIGIVFKSILRIFYDIKKYKIVNKQKYLFFIFPPINILLFFS